MSRRLFGYLGRSFVGAFAVVAFAIIGLIYLVETVELLRRLVSNDAAPWLAPYMALLKMGKTVSEVFIVVILFAAMAALARHARRLELVVARAAGLSVWQILAPTLVLAAFLAALHVAAFSPLAAQLNTRYERLESEIIRNTSYEPLATGESGLWLREATADGARVVNAQPGPKRAVTAFGQTTVFVLGSDGRFAYRLAAARAKLADGAWVLNDVTVNRPGEPVAHKTRVRLPTDTTPALLRVHTRGADRVGFWSLPGVIGTIQAAGLDADSFRVELHRLAAQPLLAIGMALIGAAFTVRTPTRGGVTRLLAGGILGGLLIYVFAQMMFALGEKAGVPAALAAWTPGVVATLIGWALVLHVENG